MTKSEYDWNNPFVLEMKCAKIITEQAIHGTNFNGKMARWHVYSLMEKIVRIDKELIPLLPPMLNTNEKSSYKRPFTLSGRLQKYPQRYADKVGLTREEIGGPFSPAWYTPFDTRKTAAIKELMFEYGWIPEEWNGKTARELGLDIFSYRRKLSRMTAEEFLGSLPAKQREKYTGLLSKYLNKHFKGTSKAHMIAILRAIGFDVNKRVPTFSEIKKELLLTYYWPSTPKGSDDPNDTIDVTKGRIPLLLKQRGIYSHRRSMLVGLLEKVREDGKLEGRANPCGTPTARCKHSIIVNIPAAYAVFGRQCRSLFTGDKNSDAEAFVIKKKIPEGMRVKLHTNLLEEYDEKKKVWVTVGSYKDYVPKGRDVFVGGDGAGLELRMLSHYLIKVSKDLLEEATLLGDREGIAKYSAALDSAYEYREKLLYGDIHKHNQKLAGLPTRAAAKSFIYSFLK